MTTPQKGTSDMIATLPPDYWPPSNNANNLLAAPIVGIDGRLYCPGKHPDGRTCHASLHRTRTPAVCPECLQPLRVESEVRP